MTDVDLAIVGSGFGGSLLAMVARRLGLRVALLERGQHPRFAIGESASPLAGVLLEQLADRYDLPRLTPLAAYGPWRRAYPEVACGLKRGFTYFKHETGSAYRRAADRAGELLVAASPSDELSDTHWYRADVDHFLVREAAGLGVEYLDRTILDGISWLPSGLPVVTGTRLGASVRLSARAVIDASGPGGFLARALGIGQAAFPGYPPTQALYSHFVTVARCADMPEYSTSSPAERGLAVPAGAHETPPYSIDDAALHHVFDGGWMWVLRFENGVTSAGVAVTDALASDLRLADGEPAWHRLLARFPSIQAQFADAEPIRAFTHMPRVPYRAAEAAGARWAMLPSAAAFVDPLFSSGIPLTLMGVERIAEAIEDGWIHGSGTQGPDAGPRVRGSASSDYSRVTLGEAEHTARFVAGCYAAFPRFDEFTAYAMFYFVAASFSEMTRRLGGRAPGFLCAADQEFAAALAQLSPSERQGPDLLRLVTAATERLNVAGLCDQSKRNWYGVDLEDTVRAAAKLGATEDQVRHMLSAAMVPRAVAPELRGRIP